MKIYIFLLHVDKYTYFMNYNIESCPKYMSDCTAYTYSEPNLLYEFGRVIEKSLTFQYFRGDDRIRTGPCEIEVTQPLPFAVLGQILYSPMELRIEGYQIKKIGEGCGYLIPPQKKNCVIVHKTGKVLFRWSHLRFFVLGSIDLFTLLNIPASFDNIEGKAIGALLKTLHDIQKIDNTTSLAPFVQRQAIGFQLLTILLKNATLRHEGVELLRNFSKLNPVITYLHRNMNRPILRQDLAKAAGLSESRLHTVFSSVFNMAPIEYLQQLRFKKAQSLLTESDLAVKTVGMEVGFADPFHFSRSFKEYCGLGPRDYRNRGKRQIDIM